MNTKKIFIFTISLFIVSLSVVAKDEKKILIIGEDVAIKNTNLENSKIIHTLQIFSVVTVIEPKIINNKIYVMTSDLNKGWVDIDYTSLIPDNWLVVDELLDLKFYVVNKNEFEIIKGEEIDTNLNVIIEEKFFNSEYFIVLQKIKTNTVQYIKSYLDGNKSKKIIFFKNKKIYYDYVQKGINGTTGQDILFPGSDNSLYRFSISNKVVNTSLKKQLETKKILFSILGSIR